MIELVDRDEKKRRFEQKSQLGRGDGGQGSLFSAFCQTALGGAGVPLRIHLWYTPGYTPRYCTPVYTLLLVRCALQRKGPVPPRASPRLAVKEAHRRKPPLNPWQAKVLNNITKSDPVPQPTSPSYEYNRPPCARSAKRNTGHSALTIHPGRSTRSDVNQLGRTDFRFQIPDSRFQISETGCAKRP